MLSESLPLIASPGPDRPLSSRALSGLTNGSPWRYGDWQSVGGTPAHGVDEYRVTIPCERVTITPQTRMTYAVYPEHSSRPGAEFGACGVAVDVIFDDGSSLSQLNLRDQHGVLVRAHDQANSKTLLCDQWNSKVVDLGALAGRVVDRVELVLASGQEPDVRPGEAVGPTTAGWLDSVVFDSTDKRQARTALEYVDTRRGTHSSSLYSRGNTFPAVAVPNGFLFASPVTDARTSGWIYSYHQHDPAPGVSALQAFSITHQASPWMGDRGVVQLMPASGAQPAIEPGDRALRFRHSAELARPDRYDVQFDDGVSATVSATSRSAVFRFLFPGDVGSVVIDQATPLGRLEFDVVEGEPSRFTGVARGNGAEQPMYFVARANREAVKVASAKGERASVAGYLTFSGCDDEAVTIQLGTSFISIDQAWKNLDLELRADETVDNVAARAADEWNERLERVQVDGATDDQRTTLYSSLYRMFLYPNSASENVGTREQPQWAYADFFRSPNDAPRLREGRVVVNNGFWDTYRTVWPALCLFDPEHAGRLLDGFVEHFRATGSMPRWSAPEPKDCMVGTSSDLVFADAAVNGVPFDLDTAYDSALHNATVPSDDPATGRKGLATGIFQGFIDQGTEEGMSWSLENAIADYGIFRFSERIAVRVGEGHPRHDEYVANAEYFRRRAAGYRLLFDDEVAFFRGRPRGTASADAPFDPAAWGGDYTETNAWGMAFTAVHDGAGLARLYGGRDGLEAKLDQFFATPETGAVEVKGSYPVVIHEMTEVRNLRMGMLGLSNQPAHHIPYMYLFTRAPHKTQRITREALARFFTGSEIGQGYPGDEDNGEMSAWYVFSALGLYPLTLASGGYALTSPLFDRAAVRLANGSTIEITAHRQDRADVYIQRVRVADAEWVDTFVPQALLADGARIEFDLGPNPSEWGTHSTPPSLSDSGVVGPLRDLLSPEQGDGEQDRNFLVRDDDSSQGMSVATGISVECEFGDRAGVGMYTVTAGPGLVGWRLEGSTDGVTWQLLDRRDDEHFRWERQTRPFLVKTPSPIAQQIRFVVERCGAGAVVYQLECFAQEPPVPDPLSESGVRAGVSVDRGNRV